MRLVSERGLRSVVEEIYQDCLAQRSLSAGLMVNHVKRLYALFTEKEISEKIA